MPLTVTATESKGIEATLELTEHLLRHGCGAAPHLPARQFVDADHVGGVAPRLREAGARDDPAGLDRAGAEAEGSDGHARHHPDLLRRRNDKFVGDGCHHLWY
ncbi:hypothetical protein [Halosaccharopolyspora lacisalsi]|uniref:hypothetical protein n=1 Tax=Halosaccharopolyspora lacisalsi TaxID=1000566 RepID=UPI001F3B70C4|nr:hypothetical protein [Halosaccharopolyspora lacisalsi]